MLTRCSSLVWRTPSLTASHSGSRRLSTVNRIGLRPNANCCRQVLGTAGAGICSGVLLGSSTVSRLRRRLTDLTRQFSGIEPLSGGWKRKVGYFDAVASDVDKIQVLLKLVPSRYYCG